MDLKSIISAAPLKGRRTYIIGTLQAVTPVLQFLVGDLDLTGLVNALPVILNGLSWITMRAAVNQVIVTNKEPG